MSESLDHLTMLSHLLSLSEGEIPQFMAFIRKKQDSFEHELRKEGEFWMNLIDKAIDEFIDYTEEKKNELTFQMTQASENEFYALVRRWQGITDEDMAEARRSFDRRRYTGMYLSAA
jgi:hypothetical protein